MVEKEIRKKIVGAREKGMKTAENSRAYGYRESGMDRMLRQNRE